jgi:hypothetical protein
MLVPSCLTLLIPILSAHPAHAQCQDWRAGPLDTQFGFVNGINALAPLGPRMVAGGDFQFNSTTPNAVRIVAWNGHSPAALGSGMNGSVAALTSFTNSAGDNELVAGGFFTTAGGVPAARVARWIEDPSGSPPAQWQAMGPGLNDLVFGLERFRGRTVAGGAFTASGATSLSRIARFNESTLAWDTISTGMNGSVRALKSYSINVVTAELVAAGDFTTAGGVTANHIAVRAEGSLITNPVWAAMGPGFNAAVFTVERHAGSTYAGGGFTLSGSTTVNRIARFTGTTWVPVGNGTGFNGSVSKLLSSGGNLYAAGSFTSVDGIPAARIARWDGTAWHAVDGGANLTVSALARFNGELHAGGTFATVDSPAVTSPGWGRYLETGVPWVVEQPLSLNMATCNGSSAGFRVFMADGYDGLTFQWRKDGVPLVEGPTGTGSTIEVVPQFQGSSLRIDNDGSADQGGYDCVISNTCGSVTSAAATLTNSRPGACCLASGGCELRTQATCPPSVGVYQGDCSECTHYSQATCTGPLEDISTTGTIAPNASGADDFADLNIPIGFAFPFFGSVHTAIHISPNGLVGFDATSVNAFINAPIIPDAAPPNAIICPLWDDFNPGASPLGAVYYQTLANPLRFVVQWHRVRHIDGGTDNTFQAVLFPSGDVVFRYGALSTGLSATIGIEDGQGADGLQLSTLFIVNSCRRIVASDIRCQQTCGSADFNCDGDIGTDADIETFFACLGGACPPPPCTGSADFNGDGDLGTDADIEAFFRVLAGGAC